MSNKFDIQKTDIKAIKEYLTPVELILLEHIYMLLIRKNELMKRIFESASKGEYKKVEEDVQEMKYIDQWNGSLAMMKDQFFEHASNDLLNAIINRQPFKLKWGSDIMVTTDVLKEFRYSSEFKINHPKAEIAKKLGAKLVS